MKVKKFLALAIIGIMSFTGIAFSAPVEDTLSKCPDESAYMVLRLEDAQEFMKWIFSRQNIDTFMPLILASEDSNEILGAIEMISAFAENTPLKSTAILAGMRGEDVPALFFQMAFTVKPESDPIVKRISDGSAKAVDIAKLFLGNDNPIVAFAETMIKVENTGDNVLKIDNELFLKAVDGTIILGLSEDNIKSSINAIEHSDLRLFGEKADFERKFNDKDFLFFHVAPKTAKIIDELDDDDDDKGDDDFNLEEYMDKPLNIELGFSKIPDKFIMSIATNWKDALKKAYRDKIFANNKSTKPVKGGYMNLAGVKAPLLAFSGFLDIGSLKNSYSVNEDLKTAWEVLTKNLRLRFGITEENFVETFKGPFSLSIGDNVTFETFKLPALYTQTTTNPEKFFGTLSKSQHFHKIKDGILQVDSSVSPVPCLVENKGDVLGIHFAELDNISKKPELKPALESALSREAVSIVWIDFAQIQSWLFDSENSVMPMVEPIARLTGYGEIFDAVKDVLNAELSVPSLSVIGDSIDMIHVEFNLADIKPSNGLFSKLVSASKKFMSLDDKKEDKVEDKDKETD